MPLTDRHGPDEEPDLLTANEVLQILRVSSRTLDRWVNDARLPVLILPSGHRRFRRVDVLALLTDRAS